MSIWLRMSTNSSLCESPVWRSMLLHTVWSECCMQSWH